MSEVEKALVVGGGIGGLCAATALRMHGVEVAHATTLHLAQGAAMAIEDAVLLAELIGSERRLDDAMSEFMRRRFDRTKFVVDTSQRIAETELDEWAGRRVPDGEGGKLLHAGTLAKLEAY